MKTILKTLAVTTALVAMAGTANAQSLGSATFNTAGNANNGTNVGSPNGGNTSDSFLITGTVPLDCSFYTGGANTTINLGNIGIVAAANVAVNNAFDMAGTVRGSAFTSTAGCNFNNTVTITKTNGPLGLVNQNVSGFDSGEFQANIPYAVTASFQATTNTGAGDTGATQALTVLPTATTTNASYGAWRSPFTLSVEATPAALGLVAGTYTDTVTVVFQTF